MLTLAAAATSNSYSNFCLLLQPQPQSAEASRLLEDSCRVLSTKFLGQYQIKLGCWAHYISQKKLSYQNRQPLAFAMWVKNVQNAPWLGDKWSKKCWSFSRMQSLVIYIVSCNVYFHAIELFLYHKTQLYRRFPKLHVYAYGAAPCVDYVIADACSQFVTRWNLKSFTSGIYNIVICLPMLAATCDFWYAFHLTA